MQIFALLLIIILAVTFCYMSVALSNEKIYKEIESKQN